jgi:hypothetical protein
MRPMMGHNIHVLSLVNFDFKLLFFKKKSQFCLSYCDLPNHNASCCTLGTIGKLSTSKGAPSWFHSVDL